MTVNQLMAAIPLKTLAGRFARASMVNTAPATVITDEAKIPDEYFDYKVERHLRRAEVLADLKVGVVIEGAEPVERRRDTPDREVEMSATRKNIPPPPPPVRNNLPLTQPTRGSRDV